MPTKTITSIGASIIARPGNFIHSYNSFSLKHESLYSRSDSISISYRHSLFGNIIKVIELSIHMIGARNRPD